jgi:hypothetical protein
MEQANQSLRWSGGERTRTADFYVANTVLTVRSGPWRTIAAGRSVGSATGEQVRTTASARSTRDDMSLGSGRSSYVHGTPFEQNARGAAD